MAHLVIGGSRGIGREFVKQLLTKYPEATIYATARDVGMARELSQEEKRVVWLKLDVTSEPSAKEAAQELQKHTESLDSIIASAGIQVGHAQIFSFPVEDFRANLETNVIGAFISINAFLPFLLASKSERRTLTILTSILSSMDMAKDVAAVTKDRLEMEFMPAPAYIVSQTARNMLGVQYALELHPKGIPVICMSPGWVKTEMGGPLAMQEIDFSVAGMLSTIDKVEVESGEIFKGFHGGDYPW